MKELLGKHGKTHFNGRSPAYDGRKGFYTAGGLPFTSKDFNVELIDRGETGDIKRKREFKVSVKLASIAGLSHLRQFLQGESREAQAPHDIIQVLDVVLRQSRSEKFTVVGRSFFDPSSRKSEIGFGVECWKGFYQSLRPTQIGMSLNMDVSATAFYEPIPVVDFVVKYLNLRDPTTAASETFSKSDQMKLEKALRGVEVEAVHGESKRYRVSGISSQPTEMLKFFEKDRGEKLVAEYFKERYKISLRYTSWPALQSGKKPKPIYLPMELCNIVGKQKYPKKLNDRQVTALLKKACRPPSEREESIEKIARDNNYENDKLAEEFGVHVEKELVCIDARVLPPPVIKYNGYGGHKMIRPRMGKWNMIDAKMYVGATVKFWTCLNFSTLRTETARHFCNSLVSMCRDKGIDVKQTPIYPVKTRSSNEIETALSDVHRACNDLELLIIILPDRRGSYGRIKRVCETELGIVSQCCQPKHATNPSRQYLESVALKINVKTGGKNSVLVDAIARNIPAGTDSPTIIFGADVSHPQPGEDSSPSIAAVVATMDWPTATTYRGRVSAQQHRVEIIQDLFKLPEGPATGPVNAGMISELLLAFLEETGRRAERIIFYRDGVGEGQFSQVLLSEVNAIRKACQYLDKSYFPKLTFIVVQKRHHTRLFPADPPPTDKSGNVRPGTVVDRKICHPSGFDFYLCSHAGIQGTSRPVHYHVLLDENNFSADNLQTLTNDLCYTYARCTRSVSVVPPAYYAHLAALRARYYIEEEGADAADAGPGMGSAVRREAASVRPLPPLSPNIKNVMFYC